MDKTNIITSLILIYNMGYIYKITNLINNKVYIGKTERTVNERWKDHVKNAKTDKYQNIILY